MKKKEKKPATKKSAFRSIAVRVIALALGMWLCFAGLLTWTVSEDIFRQVDAQAYEDTFWKMRISWNDFPGDMECMMIHNLRFSGFGIEVSPLFPFALPLLPETNDTEYWRWTDSGEFYDYYDCSEIYFDINGEPLMTTGNRMCFRYTDVENWQAEDFDEVPKGYAWIDLDAIDGAVETLEPYLEYDYDMALIRLTGWFEGNEFHPATLERGWGYVEWRDLPVWEVEVNNDLDKQGKLNWETLLTVPVEPEQELITIYGWNIMEAVGYEPKPVTVDGKKYESLTAWRLASDYAFDGDYYYPSFVARGLWETVISYTDYCYNEGTDSYFYYSLTVRFKPLQSAMRNLLPTYIVTALLVAVAVWMILRKIRRYLTEPLERLNRAVQTGEKIMPYAAWTEPYALQSWYNDTRQALLDTRTEITRLTTALDYAKDAEEYRKRLISDITHELKTPLAVIHSYAEGLQAEIAPEKKEQYVQVILDEAERMDGMVLQMLDLSRLESGRVKLKVENFSFSDLITYVTGKFEPLMAEKNLTLRLEMDENVNANGDEARLEQVITNFMSNAVKYSPVGGEIYIRAFSGKTDVFFNITNTANHLSEAGLQKVFDSFYREDSSRTEKSTGLGLAIVKQIVSLHNGKCHVYNTILNDKNAVEFGFNLPI